MERGTETEADPPVPGDCPVGSIEFNFASRTYRHIGPSSNISVKPNIVSSLLALYVLCALDLPLE